MRATRPVAGSAAEPPRIARPTTAGAVGNEVVQPIEVRVPAGGVAGRVLDTEQTVIDDEQWRFLLHARGRARAPNCATLCGRPYFPRAVFFFGFGFLVFPVLSAGASHAGNGDRERLLQTSKTGEGRAPVRSAQPEPRDGGIATVPADDLPGERIGLGRPLHPQLITSRPNDTKRGPHLVRRPVPRGAASTPPRLETR